VRAARLTLLWVVLGSLLAACASDPSRGYSFAPTYEDDVRTVAVPVFDNQTFSHGVEFRLTEAIIKEIRLATPWRVVNPGTSDTTIEGRVVESELRRVTTRRATGLVQEQALVLTVDFDWMDNRTGETLVSRRRFSVAETFSPARPVQERLETGEFGATQRLAHDIVSELRSKW